MLLLVHTFAWLPIELARFAIIKLKNVDLVKRVYLIYCYRLHSHRWQCKLNLKEDVTYVIERGTRCAGLCKRRKYQSFFYFYCVRRAVNCIIVWRCRNPINWYQVRDRITPHFSVYNVLTSKLFLISLFLFLFPSLISETQSINSQVTIQFWFINYKLWIFYTNFLLHY